MKNRERKGEGGKKGKKMKQTNNKQICEEGGENRQCDKDS